MHVWQVLEYVTSSDIRIMRQDRYWLSRMRLKNEAIGWRD